MSESKPKRPRGRPRKNPIVHGQSGDIVGKRESHPSSALSENQLSPLPSNLKVHIYPSFGDADQGDGGIRRVVEGQLKHLPKFGIEIVNTAEEADVIACHAMVPPAYVKLYPRKTFVALIHGMYWSEYKWENWAIKANADVMENIRVSDAIVACSEWVANSVRRHTSRPTYVINHGIDIDEWNMSDSPKDYVLWNKTRPDPVCDPEPMNLVAELLPDVKFISTFGKEAPNVVLTGRLEFSQAKKLIEQAGVYLCTTRETFGVGTLEALACGVPVVGFNFGGQKEFIEHEVDGWLSTPGNIEEVARGIKWALQNREHISLACRKKAAQFTWEKAAQEYATVFYKAYADKNQAGPRTSIIVTNYNLHNYLANCLDSVLKQTDQDWECIVVDDASPDPSGIEIVESYVAKDSRFKVIANKKNVYLAEARNIGIREAHGRYILPLDADDMLDSEAVQILAEALDTDRTIHVAYGNVKFTEEDGVTLSDYTNYGGKEPGHSGWPFPFIYEQQMMQRNFLPYCSMYRKEVWEQTGGYRRRCRTAEDADFWSRVSSYGFRPKMISNADTLIYRNREGSMSRTNSTDWIKWFPWSTDPEITPAGAVSKTQLPIASLDPIIISVIIPVGPGHEKIVTDAIDSVDAQTFRNWECVVVNDTGEPLLTELPAWVKLIETEGREGVAKARNVGIAASKGWLFIPLDADDYLEPKALQVMFDAYKIERDIIYSDFWQTSMDGQEMSIHHCDDYNPRLLTGRKRTFEGSSREGMIHSATILAQKSIWEKVGGYDERLPAWEDWDFQLAAGDLGFCSRRVAMPLFVYRKHTGFRREGNYEFFERSKEAIARKWRKLWEGGEELMACRSCGSKPTVMPSNGWANQNAPQSASLNQEASLIQYSGNKLGAVAYRGPSGTTYWFAAGDTKWVLAQDVPFFLSMSDFHIVEQMPALEEISEDEPMLMAPGQA
jgi:glycosyltransferase involved in cell wall biosynthesis